MHPYTYIFRFFLCAFLFLCSVESIHATTALQPLEGPAIAFEQLKGKWVLINFWASWCGPCVEEIETLNAFYKAHQNNVHLFAVNVDEVEAAEQLQLARQFHLHYPSLDADATRSMLKKDVSVIPTTFVYSPDGVLRKVHYGQLSSSNLAHLIQQTHSNQLSSRD